MDAGAILGVIGLVGAAICVAAYAWGFVFKVKGFRPFAVLALFSTVVAMAQLALMLTGRGGQINAAYAMGFLLVSGLSQGLGAVKTRPDRKARGTMTRATDQS
jgi:hypothetical protein